MSGGAPATLPTVDQVEADLKSLRVHEGITPDRVEAASHLLLLPIVDSEMERRLFQDRGLAAYSAIECAVDRFTGNSRERIIVRRTLNLSGREEAKLGERQKGLQAEFALSDNAYSERERRAYKRLAYWLLDQVESPCGSPLPEELELNSGEASRPTVELHLDRGDLRELVQAVLSEADHIPSDRRLQAIQSAMPRLGYAFGRNGLDRPKLLFNLTRATLAYKNNSSTSLPPYARGAAYCLYVGDLDYGARPPTAMERIRKLISGRYLKQPLDPPPWVPPGWEKGRDVIYDNGLGGRKLVVVSQGPLPNEVYVGRTAFVEWLVDVWLDFEERDAWRELFNSPKAYRLLVPFYR